MKLFKKPKSKFYWYDSTVRGRRYRASTHETKSVRALEIASLKLAVNEQGLSAASVEESKVAVQITHIRSNDNRTQFEWTRMLFDFVRAACAGPRTARTDLSRRLGREVNVTAYSPEEFREKIKSGDHFLAAVLRGRKQFVKGGQSDLGELVGK